MPAAPALLVAEMGQRKRPVRFPLPTDATKLLSDSSPVSTCRFTSRGQHGDLPNPLQSDLLLGLVRQGRTTILLTEWHSPGWNARNTRQICRFRTSYGRAMAARLSLVPCSTAAQVRYIHVCTLHSVQGTVQYSTEWTGSSESPPPYASPQWRNFYA